MMKYNSPLVGVGPIKLVTNHLGYYIKELEEAQCLLLYIVLYVMKLEVLTIEIIFLKFFFFSNAKKL